MKVRGVGGHKKRLGCRRHERMPMRVDKARHQHASVPRNDADIGIRIDGDRIQRDSLNGVASNQHVGRGRERGSLTVEDADILKERDVAASQSSRKGAKPGASRLASPCPRLARQTPSKSATNTSDGHGMSFNFAQLFDGLSCAIFRSGQSLFIVSIENAFISFVAYVHVYLCDRMPQNQALFGHYLLPRFVCQSAAPKMRTTRF